MAAIKGYLVSPFSSNNLKESLGDTNQGNYFLRYLSDLNAKTCVLEEDYVDRDYIIDYQKFYSRSFKDYKKTTTRIHFFGRDFHTADFEDLLENSYLDLVVSSNVKKLQESYLGFVVVKDIEDLNGNPMIGRSILKTYPSQVGEGKRVFIKEKNYVSLFGIPLVIQSLPFQVQDQGVGGCATITLWSAIHPLSNSFGTPKHSPAEITEVATSYPSEFRALSLLDNCGTASIGLDIEVIKNVDIAHIAAKAYIKEAMVPPIAVLNLIKGNDKSGHAVVISGYRCDSDGEVKELYVHDDQIGPYSSVQPDGGFGVWNNEWNDRGYEVLLEKMLIPIYSKVRLSFAHINRYYIEMKKKINYIRPDLNLVLFLTSVQDYKKFLLRKQIKNKIYLLTLSSPRFMWIIRAYINKQPRWDLVYDGTSIYPKPFTSITFC